MPSRTKPVPSEGEYQPGNILDHLDKLESSKDGKYICPVCGGNDLSISKEGAITCFNSGCSWQSIMDVVAPIEQKRSGKRQKTLDFRPPTKKQLDSTANLEEMEVDNKVTELASQVVQNSMTESEALLSLSTWCKAHKHSTFAAQKHLQEKIKQYKKWNAEEGKYSDDEDKPRILRDYDMINKKFGQNLRYNRLFSQIELNGKTFEPALAKIEFIVEHGLNLRSGRDDIGDCVTKLAKQNEYHPVREYLEKCITTHGKDTKILEGFTRRYFGTTNPIHQVATIKFLISAVARAYDPGCQVDAALILQGGQGIRKSTFFRVLASSEWFDDSFGNAGDKDERLKLHCAWILEWAELESIFKRKDISQVKGFITTKIDRIRPPYGRSVEIMARSSVFCGTTNQAEFLSDSTGNRRFWVIPVEQEIDTDLLQKERDQIWAAATALYKDGVIWHLTPEESAAMNEGRKAFEATDAWEDEILDWLEGKTEISDREIFENVLKIELSQQDKRSQLRVRDILTRSNWLQRPNPVNYKGMRTRTWIKKESLS